MIHALDDVRRGFTVEADAVVVGTGAGGAVASANLARGGLRTVVLEAGPRLEARAMTRDAPLFMARYYWDGGMRLASGTGQIPVMQGRMLGGSTVVNSAIMYRLPDWVREEWIAEEGLTHLRAAADGSSSAFDDAFARVFAKTGTAPTPLSVMGRRNLMVRDALEAAGVASNPLPRAVTDCDGCNDCLTGCHHGNKQSVDRCYLPEAVADGAEIYTCCEVDRILFEGARAVGVHGVVVDPVTFERGASFVVRAPRVVLAAGAVNTPALLWKSGYRRRPVGDHLAIHMTAGCVGFSDRVLDPWVGATQGWGAISTEIRGLKYEALWAPTPLIMLRWGDVGLRFYEQMAEVKYSAPIALVYRAPVTGSVRPGLFGPRIKLWLPEASVPALMLGLKRAVDGLFDAGARYVYPAVRGAGDEMHSKADTEALITRRIRARDILTTGNHIFGSCRMSADPERGVVDASGAVYGLSGVWVCDASVFPSPSAVNPQATIMALAELTSRGIAGLRGSR